MPPLGTLDRTPPPLFKQGPSALSQGVFFMALCVFLMVADARFHVLEPVRAVVATLLLPMQRALSAPVQAWTTAADYMAGVTVARNRESQALERLNDQALQAQQATQFGAENARLRELLGLRHRVSVQALAAEIIYDMPDPFSRKVILDRGSSHGVQRGAPVINEMGVLGQVTRTYPMTAEVTLLTDREAAIPVLNSRTGQRGAAFGDPGSVASGGGMELRFMAANADVQAGDMLTTSGVDGVYTGGLPVARVVQVDRRADSSFAKVMLMPVAVTDAIRLALVLAPVGGSLPPRPRPDVTPRVPAGAAARAASATGADHDKSPASSPAPALPPGTRIAPGGILTPPPILEVTPVPSLGGAAAGAGASSAAATASTPIFPVPDDPASSPGPER